MSSNERYRLCDAVWNKVGSKSEMLLTQGWISIYLSTYYPLLFWLFRACRTVFWNSKLHFGTKLINLSQENGVIQGILALSPRSQLEQILPIYWEQSCILVEPLAHAVYKPPIKSCFSTNIPLLKKYVFSQIQFWSFFSKLKTKTSVCQLKQNSLIWPVDVKRPKFISTPNVFFG